MSGSLMPDQNGKIYFLNRFDDKVVKYDIDSDSIDQVYDVEIPGSIGISHAKIGTDGKILVIAQTESSKIFLYDPTTSAYLPDSNGLHANWSGSGYQSGFAVHFHNWQLGFFESIAPGTPEIENVVLTATPQTDTVPFDSTITFGADNTGDADVTLNLVVDGSVVDSLTIPADSTGTSSTYDAEFLNPGSFDSEFAGSSITITANGNDVTGDFEGYIDIESAAVDDTDEEFPTADILVMNTPSQDSDCSGGNEFNIDWKTNTYCTLITTSMTRSSLATAVSGDLDSQATSDGLDATAPGFSDSGYPIIRLTSQTGGTTDNGEEIVFGVPSVLEGNGGIFNKYTVNLSGGVEEYIVNEQIDILIGGSVFATTSAITALETADSISQKIYDACNAVGSGTYTFGKNGTRVLVGSTSGAESLDLDIKNAGFSYTAQNIVEV
jgi:hypothetical protein